MISENYKLYRAHKTELQNMIFEVIENAPLNPDIFGTATQEEKEKYNRKLNEYLESRKLEIISKLKALGFGGGLNGPEHIK
jgi:hypothetical protein